MLIKYTNAETLSTNENISQSKRHPNISSTNASISDTITLENDSSSTPIKNGMNLSLPFQISDINQTRLPDSNTSISNIASNSGETALRSPGAAGDFNGDGYGDKAIGVPYEDIDTNYDGIDDVSDAGVVHVIYGSASGLSSSSVIEDQLWRQGSQGLLGIPEERDGFGSSLSAGDFNGDGKDDLAIGVPNEDIDLAVATPQNFDTSINSNLVTDTVGVVQIIYGSAQGLTFSQFPKQVWLQGMANVPDFAEENDRFGSSLSSGDFNGDLKDDLAIGVPNEDFGPQDQSVYYYATGQVQVIYGSPLGLLPNPDNSNTVIGVQIWTQNSTDIEGDTEKYDHFGSSLTTGDFNGDNKYDLAIGVIDETAGGRSAHGCEEPEPQTCQGAVNVIYGSSQGLSASAALADQYWEQGLNGLDDVPEVGDFFSLSLSSGDYNGDRKSDLAIGAPGEKIAGGTLSVGKVHVIYGSSSGLSTTSPIPDQLWQQGLNGLDDAAENGDMFGLSFASGDYDADGKSDLAIGAPGEKISGETLSVGRVHVIYGSPSGLSTTITRSDEIWQQGVNGLDDGAEDGDKFGQSLSSGNLNGDRNGVDFLTSRSIDDLIIGVPGENKASDPDVGRVHTIYGSPSGLSTISPLPDQVWQQGSNGLADKGESYDAFGWPID